MYNPKKENSPLLSVCVLTYNHAAFIEHCLDSVLSQNCSFSFEIVVTDNCSTDGTQNILKRYKDRHPDVFQLFLEDPPISFTENIRLYFSRTRGKYIAILDGDDYWCYQEKLEAQIAFLEKNDDFIGCFHDEEIMVHQNDFPIKYKHQSKCLYKSYSQMHKYKPIVYPNDIIQRLIVPTSSLVFRKTKENEIYSLKEELDFDLSADWWGILGLVKNSKLKYFNEIWGVYRDHASGITKNVPFIKFHETNIQILFSLVNDEFYSKYRAEIYTQIAVETRIILLSMSDNKSGFRLHAVKYLYYSVLQGFYGLIRFWS